MRFAGNRIEDFFGGGPDMGKIVAGGEQLRANERASNIAAQTQVESASIYGDATKKSGQVLGDAQAAAAKDAMWGSIFRTVGQVAGSAIGTFGPKLGDTTPKTLNTDYSDAFNDPNRTYGGLTSTEIFSGNYNLPSFL